MKKATTTAAVIAAMLTGNQAFADGLADAVSDDVVAAPVIAPLAVPTDRNWTGGYVGGSLAYVSSKAFYCDGFEDDEYDCNDPADSMPEPTPEGAMIGVTGGYDWQRGSFIYGVAGDLMLGDFQDSVDTTADPRYGCGDGCGLEITGMAMLRGRVGYAVGDLLPYVTAGIAVTQATAVEGDVSSQDGTYDNIVVGLGADYMVSESISAGFDILHLLEGDEPIINDDFCEICRAPGATAFSATMARVTVAYRF